VILVIDQLEEIFTACESEQERSAFLDEVGTLAADAGPGAALVVLGMRADFYARATGYPVLRQAMQARQVVLGAMSATEVRQAIVRPARAAGLTLEAGLTERLLGDLGIDEGGPGGQGGQGGQGGESRAAGAYEPGRLPLLAHALRATWQRRDGRQLTIAGYEATGGITGAIARTAEDMYARLDEAGQAAARQMFLGLVRVGSAAGDGDEAADTRRRVAADSLLGQATDPAAARRALEAFTTARLLTSGGQAVEITHEALLRRWPRLRSWIDEDRSGLLVRQQLEDSAASWAREGQDAAALYGGVRLAAAQAWAAEPGHARELTPAGREFLAASDRRRRRGARRRNAIIAVLAALSLVLAGLSAIALNERSTAQAQRDAAQLSLNRAEAGLLAAESGTAWTDFRPDTAQEFAIRAYQLYPSSPQVLDALLATQTLPITGRLLTNGVPEAQDIASVAYNPAGTIIAGTTQDDYVQLWSASTYRLLWRFLFPAIEGDHVQADYVTFSPDGRTMAVTQPGGVWLFNVANPARPVHVATLPTPAVPGLKYPKYPQVTTLAFSPDGQTIAASISTSSTASAGFVMLWNASTGAAIGEIPEPYLTEHLAFTPDGRSLVTATANSAVDLWNVARRTKTAELQAPVGTGLAGEDATAVSPNGQLIAFATQTDNGNAYVIKLWSVATGKVITTAGAGDNEMTSVAFSPGGTQLAASTISGGVRLYDVSTTTPTLLGTFTGHRFPVENIAFSPDGGTLASASDDGTIDLWSTRGTLVGGFANPTVSLASSPDGRILAVSTVDSSGTFVAMYSMPTRTLIRKIPIKGIATLEFSPDGKTLAVAPRDPNLGPVGLWNVATGTMTGAFHVGLVPLPGESYAPLNSIAFSPDGTLLAVAATASATIEVWSTATLTRVASFKDNEKTSLPASFGGVFQLAFSPDGRLLASAGADGAIRVYSVPGFTMVSAFRAVASTDTLAFSPDGRLLALGNNTGDVYVYAVVPKAIAQLGLGDPVAVYTGSSLTIWTVQFQSNDTLIAGGADGNVRFWKLPVNGGSYNATIPEEEIDTHAGLVDDMSYSPSLGLLVTGSPTVSHVWQTNAAAVASSICQTLKAPVRQILWSDYLPGIPYNPVCRS
jgi:WD40 repeat protein